MDALRICEANTFDHASVHEGAMHACGHDGHTAMLLGAACELSKKTKTLMAQSTLSFSQMKSVVLVQKP